MRISRRVESLERRASGLPKPDPRYPEWSRLIEEANARRRVRRAMREFIAAMWQASGHPERAAAARRGDTDLRRDLWEARTALGEHGCAKFQEAIRTLLARMQTAA